MSESEAGPSKASPIPDRMMEDAERSRSVSVAESADSEGKRKVIDRERQKTVALGVTVSSAPLSADLISPTPLWSPITPRPRSRSSSSETKLGKRPTPSSSTTKFDSSDLDHTSHASLPLGIASTNPPTIIDLQPPPAKKAKLSTTTPSLQPLPSGPPSVQHLRVLLQPEHIELNRPRRLFEYVRQREGKRPMVTLSPPDLKEILATMRKVNDIWLRTMGEDEECLQCLAMWLRLFIQNPRMFEECVVHLLWVILRAKPSYEKIKTARLITLAKQALEKAKQNNLSETAKIQSLVDHFDKMVEQGRQSRAAATAGPSSATGAAAGSSDGIAPKKTLPSFKKTPNGTSGTSSTTTGASNVSASMSAAGPSRPRPPASATNFTPKQMTELEKILADSTAANVALERAAKRAANPGTQTTNTRPPPGASGANANIRPSTSMSTSGFRSVPSPAPMVINRASGSEPEPPKVEPTYPSPLNKWSVLAKPAANDRRPTGPYQRPPNWRNHTLRYRDGALAEAREFEQAEIEADEPWWSNQHADNSGPHGHSASELDQAEGHTMRDVTHAERTIDWYDPIPYECTNSTVHPVNTPEVQYQDAMERGQLSVRYSTLRDIPATPSEVGTRMVDFKADRFTGTGSKIIYPPPRLPIPQAPVPTPPQVQQYNPYGWQQYQPQPQIQPQYQHQHQPQHQYQHQPIPQAQGYGVTNPPNNSYIPQPQPPPNPSVSPYGAGTSSSFRPRNGTVSPAPPTTPSTPSTSSAYRPRATSAPPTTTPTDSNEGQRQGFERGASTPAGPAQPKQPQPWKPNGNPDPVPDRARINHIWRRDIRPKKSALHNPLSETEVAQNIEFMLKAPPMDYARHNIEEDEEAGQNGV